MPGESAGAADRAAAIVAAINSRRPERLACVLTDRSAVTTGRNVHAGSEAVSRWARKEYDHLVKRYAIDEYRVEGESVLALGAVQYVWAESGEVGDSSPIALRIELDGECLRDLELHDDTAAALAGFEG
jgi:hypothetical protein